MRKIGISIIVALCLCYSAFSQVSIAVAPTDKKQTVTGLGANFLNETGALLDLGVSMVRIAEGTGYDEVDYSGDSTVLDLTKFTGLNASDLQKALTLIKSGILFIGTIGTPPIWQKDTTSSKLFWKMLQSQGAPVAQYMSYRNCYICGGELRSDMYQQFGIYVSGVVGKFKQQTGVDMYAICPQNEPEFAEGYTSCVYTGAQMVSATKSIGDKFTANGITTKIIFADQTFVQNNVYPWAVLANNDAACKGYVYAFSEHDYSDDPMGGGMSNPGQWAQLYKEAHRVSPVKETWMDEGGPGYNDAKTVLQLSIGGAIEFFKSMKYGNCNAFLVHTFDQSDVIRYGSIKNMVRYIRPGSYRVTATAVSDTLSVYPLVFKDDANGATTIYIANSASTYETIKISGITGKFDVFQTSGIYSCNWIGQVDLADIITLPSMSVTTLVSCTANKLPDINPVDTLVMIENSGTKSFDLSGINDGGEGNQTLTVSAWAQAQSAVIFSSVTTTYTSPKTTGKLNLTAASNLTGMTYINIAVRDNSKAMDSMFNEKVILVPAYVIPFINKAPTMDDISDQTYAKSQINTTQLVTLTNVTDGNGSSQKLTLAAVSSAPWIATVTTQGSTVLKITPKAEGTLTITVTLSDDGVNVGGGVGSITKTFTVVIGSGINAIEEPKEGATIYPNPAHDFVIIANPELKYNEMELIDLNGRILIGSSLNSSEMTINVKSVQPGVYIIKLMNENKIQFIKIILE